MEVKGEVLQWLPMLSIGGGDKREIFLKSSSKSRKMH